MRGITEVPVPQSLTELRSTAEEGARHVAQAMQAWTATSKALRERMEESLRGRMTSGQAEQTAEMVTGAMAEIVTAFAEVSNKMRALDTEINSARAAAKRALNDRRRFSVDH
jgi:hypothetical protein